jgi:hypothetical protein
VSRVSTTSTQARYARRLAARLMSALRSPRKLSNARLQTFPRLTCNPTMVTSRCLAQNNERNQSINPWNNAAIL